jgi:ssDNA-binding Zn-finger/Zn-ribbon topoisomerase 1
MAGRSDKLQEEEMAFSHCPNCEYVQWQLGVSDGRPAGDCPECDSEMDWTITPLKPPTRASHDEREETREPFTL